MFRLCAFLFVMWALVLLGGALAVGIFDLLPAYEHGKYLLLAVRILVGISLVAAWILLLSKVKDWMFSRNLCS